MENDACRKAEVGLRLPEKNGIQMGLYSCEPFHPLRFAEEKDVANGGPASDVESRRT